MTGFGPYKATNDGKIDYVGNKAFSPIRDIQEKSFRKLRAEHIKEISENKFFGHLSRINSTMHSSLTSYFDEQGAVYLPLPQTTQMFSSLGAIFKDGEDNPFLGSVVPVGVSWFDSKRPKYLAESAQIYLELAQAINGIDKVWTISNTFRGERADYSHIPEFHHVEYEGATNQEGNKKVIRGMLKSVIGSLFKRNVSDLEAILGPKDLDLLEDLGKGKRWYSMSFKEALDALREDTKNDKYAVIDGNNFGAWEEIRLTGLCGGLVEVSEMPLDELPFFHTRKRPNEDVADNTDFILPGYRETVGSGRRVNNREELEEKLARFNLSKKEYESYLNVRDAQGYNGTSGFGLGWERLTQGLLNLPFIWSSVVFPRVDDDFEI